VPHHIYAPLPEGQLIVANVDDSNRAVVNSMRRYLKATVVDKTPPRDKDVEVMRTWYADNAHQSALCRARTCDHT
jgi:hypothetical protein